MPLIHSSPTAGTEKSYAVPAGKTFSSRKKDHHVP
jgi:hypothetical protein